MDEPALNPSADTADLSSYTTVGVIGHIDHGKTTLVGRLTGMETDTHPEEKKRGITIDLGFAFLHEGEHTLAFVDAPGHQKYVGNLLAGVSAVDVGLLVVACDQGIQEQTLEHVAILSTLRVPRLVVALTRVDLCEEPKVAEIQEEVQVFLSDFGYREFPVIPTSTVHDVGMEELKCALREAAAAQWAINKVERLHMLNKPFRMPIDRVLSVPGRGLVVAGTPWAGSVRVGDRLCIAGRQQELRVREVEVHGEYRQSSSCGQRTALNLTAHEGAPISRGDELVEVGGYRQAHKFLVRLRTHRDSKTIKLPSNAQLHTATGAVEAKLSGGIELLPDSQSVVLVECARPILGTVGQPCLFRLPYPIGSFGGGTILGAVDFDPRTFGRKRKDLLLLGEHLIASATEDRAAAWTHFFGERTWSDEEVESRLGNVPAGTKTVLQAHLDKHPEFVSQSDERFVSLELIRKVERFIVATLEQRSAVQEDHWMLQDSLLQRTTHICSPDVAKLALRSLSTGDEATRKIVELNGMWALASDRTVLSKKQKAKLTQLLHILNGNRTPPNVKELAEQLACKRDVVLTLARHCTQQNILVDLDQDLFVARTEFEQLCIELEEHLRQNSSMTVPEIKELWGLTRKHVIPLLEYCDKHGFTVRADDVRLPGPKMKPRQTSNDRPG